VSKKSGNVTLPTTKTTKPLNSFTQDSGISSIFCKQDLISYETCKHRFDWPIDSDSNNQTSWADKMIPGYFHSLFQFRRYLFYQSD
jgi:hypothetical protein